MKTLGLSHFRNSGRQGFALISTLAILVMVTVLVVAFATTMRTELAASSNFTERDRAEAVGMGMLNRLLSDHATPQVNGAGLKPFALEGGVSSTTGLPDKETATNYYAATNNSPVTGAIIPIPSATVRKTLQPIYRMVPDDEPVMDETGLVRVSRPLDAGSGSTTADAYNADFWAYDGLTEEVMTTAGATNPKIAQPKIVPQWVDYYETDEATGLKKDYPTAKVAFAIWDEGGKLDINMAGPDKVINGMAPHDLQLEKNLTTDGTGTALLAYLNNQDNGDNLRQRTNFSLRKVISASGSPVGTDVDTGDDRWLFSVRELVERKLVDPTKIKQVTTLSRDFDARPEWDGDRAPLAIRKLQQGATVPKLGAEDFLRSYINNPSLYGLFYGGGSVGPFLVPNTINNATLSTRLSGVSAQLTPAPTAGTPAQADWMQVMRLLAVLRRSLPPYDDSTGIFSAQNTADSLTISTNNWLPTEVWGIASNIIQGSDAVSDFNLVAFNPNGTWGKESYQDPRVMLSIRISPLISETTMKVKKVADDPTKPTDNPRYEVTNYVKVWNPYPFEMKKADGSDIMYGVHLWSGQTWPGTVSGSLGNIAAAGRPKFSFAAPLPGQFKVIRVSAPRIITQTEMKKQTSPLKDNGDLEIRMRPYLADMRYLDAPTVEDVYSCIQMVGYNNNPSTNTPNGRDGDPTLIWAYFHSSELPKNTGDVAWYSAQIDDPRMGSVKRNSVARETVGGDGKIYPQLSDDSQRWSWIGYHNRHALYGIDLYDENGNKTTDPDITKAKYNGKSFTVNGKVIDGYNANFGTNWPGGDKNAGVASGDNATFAKMMATFGLPGRPFLNIGEIGTVFAFRPWVTLNFANKIIPDAWGVVSPAIAPPATNKASFRPAAILDYFTTIGTPKETRDMPYLAPDSAAPPLTGFTGQNLSSRYQEKAWLFESVTGTVPNENLTGNLRPIRGRINLNTANTETLTTLLKAPYRMPPSVGLQLLPSVNSKIKVSRVDAKTMTTTDSVSDYLVTVDPDDAKALAQAITLPITDAKAIRPLRMLSDLSQLYDQNPNLMKSLYSKYPQTVISAMIGRLAQFGTVRQQAYTIDMVVRMLNPNVEKRRAAGTATVPSVTTGEVRLQARISFDSFTRKAFIESLQNR